MPSSYHSRGSRYDSRGRGDSRSRRGDSRDRSRSPPARSRSRSRSRDPDYHRGSKKKLDKYFERDDQMPVDNSIKRTLLVFDGKLDSKNIWLQNVNKLERNLNGLNWGPRMVKLMNIKH